MPKVLWLYIHSQAKLRYHPKNITITATSFNLHLSTLALHPLCEYPKTFSEMFDFFSELLRFLYIYSLIFLCTSGPIAALAANIQF